MNHLCECYIQITGEFFFLSQTRNVQLMIKMKTRSEKLLWQIFLIEQREKKKLKDRLSYEDYAAAKKMTLHI